MQKIGCHRLFYFDFMDTNKQIRHNHRILHPFFTYHPTFYSLQSLGRHTTILHTTTAHVSYDSVCDTIPQGDTYYSGLGLMTHLTKVTILLGRPQTGPSSRQGPHLPSLHICLIACPAVDIRTAFEPSRFINSPFTTSAEKEDHVRSVVHSDSDTTMRSRRAEDKDKGPAIEALSVRADGM